MKRNERNDEERRLWVENDEGLYNEWRRSRMGLYRWVRENREFIDECINRVLLFDENYYRE